MQIVSIKPLNHFRDQMDMLAEMYFKAVHNSRKINFLIRLTLEQENKLST